MSDLRTKVIKLAHQNPELRPALLPLLREGMDKTATEFKSKEALEAYLKAHPKADRNKHKVKQEYYYERPQKEVDKEVAALDTKKKVLDHVKTLEPEHQKRFHEVHSQIKDNYKNDEHKAHQHALYQVKGEANLKPRDVER